MISSNSNADQRAKRQAYWKTRRQISTVIGLEEFREIEALALPLKKTVAQLVMLQSRAYRQSEFIPSAEMIERLDEIRLLIRSIANNLNQLTRLSNRWKRFIQSDQRQVTQMLQTLETEAFQMIRKPWASDCQCNSQGVRDDSGQ